LIFERKPKSTVQLDTPAESLVCSLAEVLSYELDLSGVSLNNTLLPLGLVVFGVGLIHVEWSVLWWRDSGENS